MYWTYVLVGADDRQAADRNDRLNLKGLHLMRTNRPQLATGLGALTACGLLLVAAPTGTSQALRRPPMPCVAIGVGVYPVGAGFCPATAGAIDWHKTARQLYAAGGGAALSNTAHQTAIPT
jgi:hypothetical protein